MSRIFGYARISRREQNINRQIRNIENEFPNAIIYQEAFTGTKIDRPKFDKLIGKKADKDSPRVGGEVQPGDTIVFDSVSRMSRNAEEGIEEYFNLIERGVNLVFLKERYIDSEVYKASLNDRIALTGSDEDEIFMGLNNYFRRLARRQIKIAFDQAQKEVDDLHQRTREGIQTARLAGKQIGGQTGKKLNVKKESPAKNIIRKHYVGFGGTLNKTECAKQAGISWNTFTKYLKELEAE